MADNPVINIYSPSLNSLARSLQACLSKRRLDGGPELAIQVLQHTESYVHGNVQTIIHEAKRCDFAIFVFENEHYAERETGTPLTSTQGLVLGMLLAIMGQDRIFIVKSDTPNWPWMFQHVFNYPNDGVQSSRIDLILPDISDKIFDFIGKKYLTEQNSPHKLTLADQYCAWWDKKNASRSSMETIQTFEGIELRISPLTFNPDVRLTYSPVVVYNRLPARLDGKTVLDLGTGSGILAICAALRGAEKVVAVDVCDSAVQDATRNVGSLVHAGKIEPGVVEVSQSNLFDKVIGSFDYILANLPISPEAETWNGLDTSVESIASNCVRQLCNHLKLNGVAIFAWASFGPQDLITRLLKEEGFDFKVTAEETFGATWYACVATKRWS